VMDERERLHGEGAHLPMPPAGCDRWLCQCLHRGVDGAPDPRKPIAVVFIKPHALVSSPTLSGTARAVQWVTAGAKGEAGASSNGNDGKEKNTYLGTAARMIDSSPNLCRMCERADGYVCEVGSFGADPRDFVFAFPSALKALRFCEWHAGTHDSAGWGVAYGVPFFLIPDPTSGLASYTGTVMNTAARVAAEASAAAKKAHRNGEGSAVKTEEEETRVEVLATRDAVQAALEERMRESQHAGSGEEAAPSSACLSPFYRARTTSGGGGGVLTPAGVELARFDAAVLGCSRYTEVKLKGVPEKKELFHVPVRADFRAL